jgi:hypothetical protein
MERAESVRVQKLAAGSTPSWLSNLMQSSVPLFKVLLTVLNTVGPAVIKLTGVTVAVYKRLPKNVIAMIYGLAICFFGGFFAVSIAAIEAFNALGGNEVQAACADIAADLSNVVSASKVRTVSCQALRSLNVLILHDSSSPQMDKYISHVYVCVIVSALQTPPHAQHRKMMIWMLMGTALQT